MNIGEAAKLATSEDYKERFIGEYAELRIRHDRLNNILKKWKEGETPLCFTPVCSYSLLDRQLRAMSEYLFILEERARIEGIELPKVEV